MTDLVGRLSDSLSGRYSVQRQLGEGGMATVFVAADLKHGRSVALKVLKPELAAVVGSERFLAEIRTTATLQHPQILPLFDSGEADGFLFYVMPFVEGETLRTRLEREGQLPVEDAVRIATDVAEALDHAHGHGVIHRDIKPANVLLQSGRALVADFGVALALSEGGSGRLTETGLSVGTPFYMSPEQAAGDQHIGPASDIYSLGCVLYEMLIGEPPFTGSTPQAVLGKIMSERAPGVRIQRPSVPENVSAAVGRCLERVAADRFRSGSELADALTSPGFRHGSVEAQPQAAAGGLARAAVAGGAFALIGLAGWSLIGSGASVEPVSRLGIQLDDAWALAQEATASRIDVAPDGSRFVYASDGPEGQQLVLRELSQLGASPLEGTVGAVSPTVSPDGEQVAFITEDGVYRMRLDGSPPVQLFDSTWSEYSGAVDWGPEGDVYFGRRGVYRLAIDGGARELVVPQGTDRRFFVNLEILPRGDAAIVARSLNETWPESEIAVVDFADGVSRVITPGVSARYSRTGHLLVVRADGSLVAIPFDEDRLELTGTPTQIGVDVGIGNWLSVDLAVTADGDLLHGVGAQEPSRQVVWVDREGFERPVDPEWRGAYESVALSPAGDRIAVGTAFGAEPRIWVRALETGAMTTLTLEGSLNRRPIWSRDGSTIGFVSVRGGNRSLYTSRADGVGPAELLLTLPDDHIDELAWTPDRSWVVYRTGISGGDGRDLYAFQPGSGGAPVEVAANPEFDEASPALSPDGRWLAYTSAESGRYDVFVRSFPGVDGERIKVSEGGGVVPVWSNSGRELFFRTFPPQQLMAAEIRTEPRLTATNVRVLFDATSYFISTAPTGFDTSLDDQHFLMIRHDDAPSRDGLVLIENWVTEIDPG